MNRLNRIEIKIAVIVPVHNRRNLTLKCLEKLKDIERNGFEVAVVVIDDGSTDGTDEAVHECYPDVVVLKGDGNLWWSGAVNKGVAYAMDNGCDFVLTLNDDIDFKKDFLQVLFDTSKKYPDSIVSSLSLISQSHGHDEIIASTGLKVSGWLRNMIPAIDSKTVSDLSNEIIFCDALPGRSLLIPVDIFREIGFFDSIRFPHGDADIEFTHRAKLAGYLLIVNTYSKVYTELNRNHFPVYVINSSKSDFIKNMFNIKFGYGFKLVLSRSFMHKPFFIGLLDLFYRLFRLFKWLFLKLVIPKSLLKSHISKKINMTLYGRFIE